MEAVEVYGFSRSWLFAACTRVEEVISFIAVQFSVPCVEMFVQDETQSPSVTVSRAETLMAGHKYRVKRSFKADSFPRRTFALGGIVYPSTNYYVPPDIDELVAMLSAGRYCALVGVRQSGKSTTAIAIKDRLSLETETSVIYLDNLQAEQEWSVSRFWGYVWDCLHTKCSYLFKKRDEDDCTDLSFKRLFLKTAEMTSVTLIIDEADTLLSASADCLDRFFSTLKNMKSQKDDYSLKAVLLVGVETVKDLLENRYYRRVEPSSTPSQRSDFSPFPHSYITESRRFMQQDVECLLLQAASDLPAVDIEVGLLAASVMQLTGGHKGLVGTCLDRIVTRKLFKYHMWIQDCESGRLSTYIFGQATYSRILEKLKVRVCSGGTDETSRLLQFLQVTSLRCDDRTLVELRDLIAEGILLATEASTGSYCIGISSSLLRTVILRRCVITSQAVSPPPNPLQLEKEWLILEAIKTLDGDTMCRPESLRATEEITYQFAFFSRIKAILKEAYPLLSCVVLGEAKQAAEHLGRRDTQERLDILVRDANNSAKFGFELVVNNDLVGPVEKAQQYYELHGAQVYVVNFTMQDEAALVSPEHDSVFFVSVKFNPSGDKTTAEVIFVDVHGMKTVVKGLELKKWDGKFSFHDL